MAAFFVDTASVASTIPLSSHTTDSGHTWAYFAGETGVPNVYPSFGKVIACGSTGYKAWRSSVASPTPDVVVDQDWYVDSWTIAQSFGPCARMNAAGNKGYGAIFIATSKKWLIVRIGASMATTTLATSATMGYTATGIYSVSLKVTGSGASISLELSVGGSVVLTATDTGASRITDAGYVGFWMQMVSVDAGAFIDSMSADTPGGGAAASVAVAGLGAVAYAGSGDVSITLAAPVSASVAATGSIAYAGLGAVSATAIDPAKPTVSADCYAVGGIVYAGMGAASADVYWPAAAASVAGMGAVSYAGLGAASVSVTPVLLPVSVDAYGRGGIAYAGTCAISVREGMDAATESLYLSVANANTHLSKASGAQYLSIARI